ncbi:Tigger transposable element-derived protein 6 [Ceratobasidium theobromae]|uniref:Tigger transposable element-derived protein 6 n=1 Tax=Ceratobasidium theobromae TaxID=1582974 RepID=A0A5N5QHP5_9AGAM|nr:Tigger transposable element-derived protein 6 [Ceratobasidium theobromae]
MAGSLAALAPTETIDDERRKLQATLSRYPAQNQFNIDETGLNICIGIDRGLATHALPGLKADKTHLTYALCTSAVGEKLPPLVIGHAMRPRCFTNGPPADYGYDYKSNKKAWMRMDIWQDWLFRLNASMQQQDRHIVLLCDNASSHSHDPAAYSHIKVVFLPPNLTAWLQPMDAGIIRNFKGHYRQLLTRHALDLDAQGVANPYKVDQLQAMRLADCAWQAVSATTIQNCWHHTGICPDTVGDVAAMLAQIHI